MPRLAEVSPMRGRSSNTFTRPIRSPRTCTVPDGRVQLRAGQAQQGGLARAVRARAPPSARPARPRQSTACEQRGWSRGGRPRRPSRSRGRRSQRRCAAVLHGEDTDSGGIPGAATTPILADRACLPVGCPRRRRAAPGSPSPRPAPSSSRCASSTARTAALAEKRVELTRAHVRRLARPRPRRAARASATATGCTARTGRGTGVRANPAKILVDPYARRITGRVTDLARGPRLGRTTR